MRLEKSTFENFVDLLRQRMEGRTLLCDFSKAIMVEVHKSISGDIRQIGVLRSGPVSLPKYPGRPSRSIEVFLLTNWAGVPCVVVTLYFTDALTYMAEIIFDGTVVTPYSDSLLSYIEKYERELKEVDSREIHEA
jgi:hypothetical protein